MMGMFTSLRYQLAPMPTLNHPFAKGEILVDSYYCNRYNTQTKRLTATMFYAVFADIQFLLKKEH